MRVILAASLCVNAILGAMIYINAESQKPNVFHEGTLEVVTSAAVCIDAETATAVVNEHNTNGIDAGTTLYFKFVSEGRCISTPEGMEFRVGALIADGEEVRVVEMKSVIVETVQDPRYEEVLEKPWYLITMSEWKPYHWWYRFFPESE